MKKIFKYLGAILGVLTGLALFVAPFAFSVKNSASDKAVSETYGLFADVSDFADVYKLADKTFQSFWITLFQIAVVVALAIAVVMLVVYVLNDMGVLKAQKLEKTLATLLLVVGLVGLVAIALCSVLNTFKSEGFVTTTTTSFGGTLIGWLTPVFALVGGLLAYLCADKKAKKKRK